MTTTTGQGRGEAAKCSLRWMESAEVDAVRDFLAAHFSADKPQNHPQWLDWILANPRGVRVCVCVDDEVIVGLSFFMPVPLRLGERQVVGAFATNTMVNERFRGAGIGTAIHDFRLNAYDVALSTGQSAANRRVYDRLGFRPVATFSDILAVGKLGGVAFSRYGVRRLYSRGIGWLSGTTVSTTVALHPDLTFLNDDWVDPRRSIPAVTAVSDKAFLEWRYVRHPYAQYRFLSVCVESSMVGFAVVRELADGTARLVDAYATAEGMPTVLSAVRQQSSQGDMQGLVTGDWLRSNARRCGFDVRDHASAVLGHSISPDLQDAIVSHDWAIFAGESDKDR